MLYLAFKSRFLFKQNRPKKASCCPSLTNKIIPNDICKRAGMASAWVPIDELAIFPFDKNNANPKEEVLSPYSSDKPSSVYKIRQNMILFHPVLRKLVNESNGIFLNFQASMVNKPLEQKVEILKISRQYRSIIRACLDNLKEDITKNTTINKDELKDYITIFYSVECIWHLCEILFMEPIYGNIVLPYLLDWVRFHFPRHERNAAILLSGDVVSLESQEGYWETVFGNLLQGQIKVVRNLLKQHSAAESAAFKTADQILRIMPTFNVVNNISVNEFNLQWRHWSMDVQLKIDAKQFISNSNLDLLMRLIIGEEQAWAEIQTNCEAWYEFLAGWLIYTEPTVKSFELGQFAKLAINKMRVGNDLKHLDRVLLATMEFDLFEVIKEIQYMTENGWFVSHLTDILYHSGRLTRLEEEVDNFSAERLRESFILNYGISLTGHSSLWQVGLSYLDYCPNDGMATIELLLPRIKFDSEAKAHKLVREAKSRELHHVAQTICKVQGMRCLARGRLGNALTWSLKSQDGPFTSYLADKFLQEYIKKGELDSVDLLDNLGSCMLASDRLIFLGKYYEFHKLYQAGEFQECASLLIGLLASKIVPKYFWSVLLTEAIPLLESENIVFSSNDTYTILHCLEEKESTPQLSDKVSILRLAAARNLSRALISEAQA